MKKNIDLSVNLCGIRLKNPTILASGILGLDSASLKKVVRGGAGAVTMKSLTSAPRKGHNNPILVEVVEGGFLNAVGYANKGIDHGIKEFGSWRGKVPLIGSIVATGAGEFVMLAEKIQQIPISALEIVLSCPHTPGFGLMAGQGSPQATEKIAKEKAVCDYGLIFGASQNNNVGEFKKIIPRVIALKIYMDQTTGTLLIEDTKLLDRIFAAWESEKPIMVHAEGDTLLKALPLAKKYHRHLHCCHVSLQEEVALIKRAKDQKINITAEVTPHHLFLSSRDAKRLGPFGIMKPPLRDASDINALWKGIADGTIDMIATDHAPHTREEKESGNVPFGVPGLETALPLLLTAVHDKRLTIEQVIALYHTNPRTIFNLPKQRETYIEVDLENKYEIKNKELKTKCGWSPFDGWEVYGKIHEVKLRGRIVYQKEQMRVQRGFGKNVNLMT